MDLKELCQQMMRQVEEFVDTPHFRGRIHMAEHIFDTMDDIYKAVQDSFAHPIEEESPTTLHERQTDLEVKSSQEEAGAHAATKAFRIGGSSKLMRFRKMTMAEGAEVLLTDQPQLHGSQIEKMLKDGGYRSYSENFQSALTVALKRAGKFENIGGNMWRLKRNDESSDDFLVVSKIQTPNGVVLAED